MALFKCQACGAPLEVRDGTEVAFCPYCGMKQTLPKDPVQVISDGTSVESLLKRAFMFLEDGEFAKADEYCNRVLDIYPENARAYLGKLMADYKFKKQEDLVKSKRYFVKNPNYEKVMRFGDEKLKKFLDDIWENRYNHAIQLMNEKHYEEAAEKFDTIKGYRDADKKYEECIYHQCLGLMEIEKYEEAEKLLARLPCSEESKYEERLKECLYQWGIQCMTKKDWSKAVYIFRDCNGHTPERRLEDLKEAYPGMSASFYNAVLQDYRKLDEPYDIRGYKDVEEKLRKCERMLMLENLGTGCMTVIIEAFALITVIIFVVVHLF